jgi:hypothetical protein
MRSTATSDGGEKVKKRKGRKERMKAKVAFGQPEEVVIPTDTRTISSLDTTSSKKRKGNQGNGQTGTTGEVKPQKKKKKHQTA